MTENLTKLADHDAVISVFDDGDAVSIAVQDAGESLYLISFTEDGEMFYVGVPVEADEDGEEIDRNTGRLPLEDDADLTSLAPRYPLTLLGKGMNA